MDGQICKHCKYYRVFMRQRHYGDPVEKDCGACMLLPPSVQYRQAAADSRETWAGPVTSVVQPGLVQGRPVVNETDYCSQFIRNPQ